MLISKFIFFMKILIIIIIKMNFLNNFINNVIYSFLHMDLLNL